MIKGIGIDLIELKRIESTGGRLAARILTDKEKKKYDTLYDRRKTEFLAGRFAAKEAYAKACGCGIGAELAFKDICVSNDEKGRPLLKAEGETNIVHLSVSHSRDYACAHVVIETR
ncbi:holo-ACP synthase [Alkalicoccus saliphilus]|uniref:Holo-[acyl-carrier-protein] synthase n=1 Tax=Alkalicoccus saliphilus TaxID=200989 RepID=A0A2T4U5A0_9BACI|nr:holo-ACP synthase [Alkalicoccus saliphilus]PTL38580.1 holo-[acyl-carrier-protein] synthase [Alkalicoccus saliphilus]